MRAICLCDELALNTQKSTIFAIQQHISLSSVNFLISQKPYIREKFYFTTLTPSARADFQGGRSLKITLHTYIKNVKQLQYNIQTISYYMEYLELHINRNIKI